MNKNLEIELYLYFPGYANEGAGFFGVEHEKIH